MTDHATRLREMAREAGSDADAWSNAETVRGDPERAAASYIAKAEALEAGAAALEAMTWRPIETAPKDGDDFFVLYDQAYDGDPGFGGAIGRVRVVAAGEYDFRPHRGHVIQGIVTPTHWRPVDPLPPAPEGR